MVEEEAEDVRNKVPNEISNNCYEQLLVNIPIKTEISFFWRGMDGCEGFD